MSSWFGLFCGTIALMAHINVSADAPTSSVLSHGHHHRHHHCERNHYPDACNSYSHCRWDFSLNTCFYATSSGNGPGFGNGGSGVGPGYGGGWGGAPGPGPGFPGGGYDRCIGIMDYYACHNTRGCHWDSYDDTCRRTY